ncbi:MAG: rhodanese-like domain-containing protein [Proteobacteria bacterium]|nr:rhodanese-like domain-containing protein [Pseudomonadota bacterium]
MPLRLLLAAGLAAGAIAHAAGAQETRPNPLVDYRGFVAASSEAERHRRERLVSEEEFRTMARADDTVVLDTRSRAQYEKLHVAGAVHLNFSDITEATLARVIPSKSTRVLIYCNNNFADAPVPFPAKRATAALNIPTFATLYIYGYREVYELQPLLNVEGSTLAFEGSDAAPAGRRDVQPLTW